MRQHVLQIFPNRKRAQAAFPDQGELSEIGWVPAEIEAADSFEGRFQHASTSFHGLGLSVNPIIDSQGWSTPLKFNENLSPQAAPVKTSLDKHGTDW